MHQLRCGLCVPDQLDKFSNSPTIGAPGLRGQGSLQARSAPLGRAGRRVVRRPAGDRCRAPRTGATQGLALQPVALVYALLVLQGAEIDWRPLALLGLPAPNCGASHAEGPAEPGFSELFR